MQTKFKPQAKRKRKRKNTAIRWIFRRKSVKTMTPPHPEWEWMNEMEWGSEIEKKEKRFDKCD